MPQLLVKEYRKAIFKWLDAHPKAKPKEVRQEFKISRSTIYDYIHQWKVLHSHDQVKKDLIYLHSLMLRKMITKGQITISEKESLYDIEFRIHAIEDEMGIVRKTEEDILEPLHLKKKEESE